MNLGRVLGAAPVIVQPTPEMLAWFSARRWLPVRCRHCAARWNVRDDRPRFRCLGCGALQRNPSQRTRAW